MIIRFPQIYRRFSAWRTHRAIERARLNLAAERQFQAALVSLNAEPAFVPAGRKYMDELAELRRDGKLHPHKAVLPAAPVRCSYLSKLQAELAGPRQRLFDRFQEIAELSTCSSTASTFSYEFILAPVSSHLPDTPSPGPLSGDDSIVSDVVSFKLSLFCLRTVLRSATKDSSWKILRTVESVVVDKAMPALLCSNAFGVRVAILELYADIFHYMGEYIDAQTYKEMVAQLLTCGEGDEPEVEYALCGAFSLLGNFSSCVGHIVSLLHLMSREYPSIFILLCLSLPERVDQDTHRAIALLFAHYSAEANARTRLAIYVALSRYFRLSVPTRTNFLSR